jgi:hypothetical protein
VHAAGEKRCIHRRSACATTCAGATPCAVTTGRTSLLPSAPTRLDMYVALVSSVSRRARTSCFEWGRRWHLEKPGPPIVNTMTQDVMVQGCHVTGTSSLDMQKCQHIVSPSPLLCSAAAAVPLLARSPETGPLPVPRGNNYDYVRPTNEPCLRSHELQQATQCMPAFPVPATKTR